MPGIVTGELATRPAMSMQISASMVNGEQICLDVIPEMTGRELKRKVKEMQTWDEFTSKTTLVEILIGDRLLGNDQKMANAGIDSDTVSIVFKPPFTARCSDSRDIDCDSGLYLIVEIPGHETCISEGAFEDCTCWPK